VCDGAVVWLTVECSCCREQLIVCVRSFVRFVLLYDEGEARLKAAAAAAAAISSGSEGYGAKVGEGN